MNGGELPCGSVLHVEQARSNRDYGQEQELQTNRMDVTTQVESQNKKEANLFTTDVSKEGNNNSAEVDEDLDSFFDSL